MKLDGKAVCAEYGRRGGNRLRTAADYRVGDETLSIADIAARLGVPNRTARERFQRAAKNGPVTWESLQP